MANSYPVNRPYFPPVEFSIGWRYVRAGRRTQRGNRFISFISWLSAMGIALGVAALIVVLSVMNGFQKEVRDRMLSVLAHIEVFETSTAAVALDQWAQLTDQLRSYPQVLGVAPFVSGQVMMTRGEVVRGALVRGIDPRAEAAVSQIAQQVRDHRLPIERKAEA